MSIPPGWAAIPKHSNESVSKTVHPAYLLALGISSRRVDACWPLPPQALGSYRQRHPSVFDRDAIDFQSRKGVLGIRGEVPAFGRVVEQRATTFQDEAQAFVHERTKCSVGMAIGRDFSRAQVFDKLLGMTGMELRGLAH